MTDSKFSRVSREDVQRYHEFRRKLFFTKTDLPLTEKQRHYIASHADLQRLKRWVKQLVEATFQQKPQHITNQLGRSTLHHVFGVTTSQQSYVVRINAWPRVYRELYFLAEAWVMEKVRAVGVPCPTVYSVDVSRREFPFDYEISSIAPGVSLFDVSHTCPITAGLLKQYGKLVATIHGIPVQRYGPLNVGAVINANRGIGLFPSWWAFIQKNLDSHIDYCARHTIINAQTAQRIRRVFRKSKKLLVNVPSVLLHGDVANHNAFTDRSTIISIIDWEDCICGDPIYDIAYYATGCIAHEEWLRAFLSGYETVRKFPKDYEHRFWSYYLRIALDKAIRRHRFGIPYGTEGTSLGERIVKGLSVVESLS